MGRSFDRGGQSRKERERGKRRSYRQAERNREALEAIAQAKRKGDLVDAYPRVKAPRVAAAVAVTPRMPGTPPADRPVAIIEQKRPGFIAKFFGRIFKKSA